MDWKELTRDGDLGLLALFFFAGLIPLVADVHVGRAFSAEATLGGLASLCSGWAMTGRLLAHHRATSLRRDLLRRHPSA